MNLLDLCLGTIGGGNRKKHFKYLTQVDLRKTRAVERVLTETTPLHRKSASVKKT